MTPVDSSTVPATKKKTYRPAVSLADCDQALRDYGALLHDPDVKVRDRARQQIDRWLDVRLHLTALAEARR